MRPVIKSLAYPLVTAAGLLGVWISSLAWFRIPDYILPKPSAVLVSLKVGYIDGLYWPHLLVTLEAIIFGYLIGSALAFLLGVLLAESTTFEKFAYPYIIALQSMPKVALAPLIIVWFGFGLASKIVMVALICFFPVFISTVVGIRQADPNRIDLLRVFSASRAYIFLEVKLPSAAGHIFAGLQISVVLGLIGAVVSEFIASERGLGNLIQSSSTNLDLGATFAVLLTLAVMGIAGNVLVRMLHRKFVFWEQESGTRTVMPSE